MWEERGLRIRDSRYGTRLVELLNIGCWHGWGEHRIDRLPGGTRSDGIVVARLIRVLRDSTCWVDTSRWIKDLPISSCVVTAEGGCVLRHAPVMSVITTRGALDKIA